MNKQFLENLIKCPSPAGNEVAIQHLWLNELKDYAHALETDMAGNAIAVLNPEAPFKVLLAGHCDEIAFMVNHIDDKGFLSVVAVGGISPKLALGSRVRVLGQQVVKGVIAVPPHHKGGAKDEVKIQDVTIDIGAKSQEEAAALIQVGDHVIYDVDYDDLLNDTFTGRALDNRTGAFIIAEVIKALSKETLKVGVYAVSTVNEETTMGGAHFAAANIVPNMAIACDVTFATDSVGSDPKKDGDIKLGGGPVISIGSQINTKINALIKTAAQKHDLPLQVELTPSGTGTDADKMRFSGKGVPVALISLPLRYMHSPSEVVSLVDIQTEIDLIVHFIKDLTGTEELKPVIV
jgi:endoglucanase